MQSILYIEASEDGIDTTSMQIASRIKKIPAGIRGHLKGISIGPHMKGKTSQIAGLLDEILLVDVPQGMENNPEVIANILTDIAGREPAVLFLGFTHQGMEIAPAVGWRLGRPVITACVDLDWTSETALCRRSILGGKAVASFSMNMTRGAVISVQKGVWKDEDGPAETETGDSPVTQVEWKNAWAADKTEIVGISQEQFEEDEDITKADILISAGRGLGDPDNLPIIKELAERLGGMISCSRPVVDLGWLPASRQVGISGKTVAPVIYLALGISGQSNHVAGMNAAGNIIAVNKDPSAPIFNIARYGVVDDLLAFVPELIDQLKERKSA